MGVASTIAKNSLFNFIARLSEAVVTLVVGIVLARALGTEQYGVYALLMWFLGFAMLAANFGLGSMAARFIAEALGRHGMAASAVYVRWALIGRVLAATLITLVVVVTAAYWAELFGDSGNRFLFVLLALGILPNAVNHLLTSIFAGFQKYEYGAYAILAGSPLRAVAIIVAAAAGLGIKAVLIINASTWLLSVGVGLVLLHRLVPLHSLASPRTAESATRKSAFKYALATMGYFGTNYFLWSQAEVMFLGAYRSAEEVGFYTLASKVPIMLVTLVPMVFGAVLLPAFAEQFGKGDVRKIGTIYTTSSRYLMLLTLPLAAAGIALARPLIVLLYGDEYIAAVVLMQVLFLPLAMRGIASGSTEVIFGMNQPSLVLKVGLVLAFLNVGLSLWLIPAYGMMGAAIASSVPRLLVLPLYVRSIQRRVGTGWPLGDTARIVVASSVMGISIFGLQSWLGGVLGLAVSVPVGLAVYCVAILALRVVRADDLDMLRGMQSSLPPRFRKRYGMLLSLAGSITGTERAR